MPQSYNSWQTCFKQTYPGIIRYTYSTALDYDSAETVYVIRTDGILLTHSETQNRPMTGTQRRVRQMTNDGRTKGLTLRLQNHRERRNTLKSHDIKSSYRVGRPQTVTRDPDDPPRMPDYSQIRTEMEVEGPHRERTGKAQVGTQKWTRTS